jgi:hypothetical protein
MNQTPVLNPMTEVLLHEGLAREVWRDFRGLPEGMAIRYLMKWFTRDDLRAIRNDLQLWKEAEGTQGTGFDLRDPLSTP